MADTFTFMIKPITDLSDVKANVGEIQKAFSKLKLPDKLGKNLTNELDRFDKAYKKFTDKQSTGIKTSGDVNGLTKASNEMLTSYQNIVDIFKEIEGTNISNVFDIKTDGIEKVKKAQNNS